MPAPRVMPISALRANPMIRLTRLPTAITALLPTVPPPPSLAALPATAGVGRCAAGWAGLRIEVFRRECLVLARATGRHRRVHRDQRDALRRGHRAVAGGMGAEVQATGRTGLRGYGHSSHPKGARHT